MANRKTLKTVPAEKIKKTTPMLDVSASADGVVPIRGEEAGGREHLCGVCGRVLLTGMRPGQVRVVMRCPCGAYNDAKT
jgi:hypothetical protein